VRPGRLRRVWRGLAQGVGLDPRWLEIASGSAAVLWGGWMLCVPMHNPAYASLRMFVSDALLGTVVMVGGLLQCASVTLDHRLARIPIAAGMGSAWFLVGYAISVASPQSATPMILLALGVWNALAMLVLIRLTLDGSR